MNEKNLIELRLWSEADLPLLEQLMGDPVMTEHLGGPETPEKILKRHERYCQSSRTGKDLMFAIISVLKILLSARLDIGKKNGRASMFGKRDGASFPNFKVMASLQERPLSS